MDITTETFERSREVPAEPQVAARYRIQSVPTVAVVREGRRVIGFIGAQPAGVIGRFFDEVVLAEQTGEGDQA